MIFLETHDAISYLHDYYPVRYSQHKGISEQILAFKKGDDNAVRLFATEMKEAMDERFRGYEYRLSEMIVCIMLFFATTFWTKGGAVVFLDFNTL